MTNPNSFLFRFPGIWGSCPTRYIPKAGWRTVCHNIFYGHAKHVCGIHVLPGNPHNEKHVCGCRFSWPVLRP